MDSRRMCFEQGKAFVYMSLSHQVVSDMGRINIVIGAISAARALESAAIFEHCLRTSATPTASPKVWRIRT